MFLSMATCTDSRLRAAMISALVFAQGQITPILHMSIFNLLYLESALGTSL
jgi:hypothetical protein